VTDGTGSRGESVTGTTSRHPGLIASSQEGVIARGVKTGCPISRMSILGAFRYGSRRGVSAPGLAMNGAAASVPVSATSVLR
jgi:hypothetical protein